MLQIHLIGILCQFLPTNKNKDIIRLWKGYYLVLTSKVGSWQRSLYIIQSFSILHKVSVPRYSSPVLTHGVKKQTQLHRLHQSMHWLKKFVCTMAQHATGPKASQIPIACGLLLSLIRNKTKANLFYKESMKRIPTGSWDRVNKENTDMP